MLNFNKLVGRLGEWLSRSIPVLNLQLREVKKGSASETRCASLMLAFTYRSSRKLESAKNGVRESVKEW